MLSDMLNYDPETGVITWKVNRGPVHVGAVAGYHHKRDNYLYVKAGKYRYPAHRLAWFLHYGKWPDGVIDHINGNGLDNRLVNIREATSGENQHNMRLNRNNTSGFKGVSYDKLNRKWMAHVKLGGKFINLGRFTTVEEADAAARAGRERLHREFHNHGR